MVGRLPKITSPVPGVTKIGKIHCAVQPPRLGTMDQVDLNAAFMEETLTPTKLHPFFKPYIDKQVDMVTKMQKNKKKVEWDIPSLLPPDDSPDSSTWLDKPSITTRDCTSTSELAEEFEAKMQIQDSPVSAGDPEIRKQLLQQKRALEKRLLRINQLLNVDEDLSYFTRASEQSYIDRIKALTRALVEIGSKSITVSYVESSSPEPKLSQAETSTQIVSSSPQ